jgi:4-diphosphocytidyl-2-C-methyl-D-erythritol kinase
LAVINPRIQINTGDAFRGISILEDRFDLKKISDLPVSEWQHYVENDFESTIFPKHPSIKILKESLIQNGALYASMTGTGSSVFAFFKEKPSVFCETSYSSWIGQL